MTRSILALSVLCGLGACSNKCPEPVYEGKASDEAYLSVLDAESRAQVDPSKAAVFSAPTVGQHFASAEPPTLRWSSALMARRAPPPLQQPTQPRPGAFDWLYASAWAHLAPVNGAIYWLRFSLNGEQCPALAVLTTRTEYTATIAAWAPLAGHSVSLTGLSAYLVENRITEGPFTPAESVSFTVDP